jgi:predicted RNase H-like nuclease
MSAAPDLRFLGIDLAWGDRNRTGLAAVDGTGRLVASTSVIDDDEIAGFVSTHGVGTLVAAIDAPLVVPNATGRRPCEAEVTRLFGRYSAGTYPSNRGMPHFSPQPRGARLADRFGWSMDPDTLPVPRGPVCLEVYPHAAMVSLFDLTRVLPYKAKPGRELPSLKAAFVALLDHMEDDLVALRLDESSRWGDVRRCVEGASRKSELKSVEDEVDAIICAHLAWLWVADRECLVVHGDASGGYIVTPHPPDRPVAD